MIPTQIYKPKDFSSEVEKIKSITKSRYNYLRECYELRDFEGNTYEIDYNEGTISIN